MIKKILYVIITLSLIIYCSSCDLLPGKAIDDSLTHVMQSKKLVVGMEYSMPPMGTLDPNTGEAYGFDVDIVNEIGRRMGVDVEFIYMPWLSSDEKNVFKKSKADCICNNFDSTVERAEKYALSIPYTSNNKVFLALRRDLTANISEISGKIVGTMKNSSNEYILKNPLNKDFANNLKDIVLYKTYEEGINFLEIGQIDSMLLDEAVGRYYKKTEGEKFVILESKPGEEFCITGSNRVIAFRRESISLRSEVNQVLFEMSKDGTMSNLSNKWIGEDITVIK